ncbi:hypothetical protein HYW75_00410 [Candidatus Pacearchaeota archaeon]|nr:hypothetical protein [Candidatus Pacearchaeota archaeon]
MAHRIEVASKNLFLDVDEGLALTRPIKVYQVEGDLSENELKKISQILTDPVTEVSSIDKPLIEVLPLNSVALEKSPKPGVTDPHGEEARKIFSRTLNKELGGVTFSEQYILKSRNIGDIDLRLIRKKLGNPIVNSFRSLTLDQWNGKGFGCEITNTVFPTPEAFTYVDLEIEDSSLIRISEERYLALSLDSMKSIQALFRDETFLKARREIGLESKATDAELEGFGVSWSDHCNHNKLRAKWLYTSDDPEDEADIPGIVDNLLKTLIIDPSREILKRKGIAVSVFEDNSGVLRLNDRWNISHKVETHNHPSGEDGFGGSNTGTGGVLRDPFHTGIGMKVISSQFSFRTAHPDYYKDLPLTMQTPSRTLETVILGVEDYGNKLGVPTKSGTVMIDNSWLKPGVFVGATAVQKSEINGRPTHIKDVQPGYIAISLGGRVGKDGIHGASGSSMTHKSDANENIQVTQSVQIGNPITQKRYFDAALILAEHGLIEASQDCGAGGWHSAVGELTALCNSFEKDRYEIQKTFREKGITEELSLEERLRFASSVVDLNVVASPSSDLIKSEVASGNIFKRLSNGRGGIVMDLTNVKEKYKGLAGWEKLISESQERGVIVVRPENVDKVITI